jgi:heme oxygenase
MNRDDLVRAIDLALAGHWDDAHDVVQRDEADETAALIHGLLHAIEGDHANAAYWYRRAGRAPTGADPQGALRSLRESRAG